MGLALLSCLALNLNDYPFYDLSCRNRSSTMPQPIPLEKRRDRNKPPPIVPLDKNALRSGIQYVDACKYTNNVDR